MALWPAQIGILFFDGCLTPSTSWRLVSREVAWWTFFIWALSFMSASHFSWHGAQIPGGAHPLVILGGHFQLQEEDGLVLNGLWTRSRPENRGGRKHTENNAKYLLFPFPVLTQPMEHPWGVWLVNRKKEVKIVVYNLCQGTHSLWCLILGLLHKWHIVVKAQLHISVACLATPFKD